MEVLIGTTNPAKIKMFKGFLEDIDITFYTLRDLGIDEKPLEVGGTPEENALIKAKFYSKYFDVVLCHDSGLYFDKLDMLDKRQPGLHVRTPNGVKSLDDEEMIVYYSELVRSLGGKVLAYYLNGMAVYNKGKFFSFLEDKTSALDHSFYMVDSPSALRHPGWPLDSISLYKDTLTYFVETDSKEYDDNRVKYKRKVIWSNFLKSSLEL